MERYRIGSEASVYFVTFSVVDWLPYLSLCHFGHRRSHDREFAILSTTQRTAD